LGARMRSPAGRPVGSIRRVLISNVVCSNATSPICSVISGIPGHALEDLRLSNIVIEHQGGGTPEQGSIRVPEKEKEYPDPDMFGPMPAQGFFLRHVRGLDMDRISIMAQKPDQRPGFVLQDVKSAEFVRVQTAASSGIPIFVLADVGQFRLRDSPPVADVTLGEVQQKQLFARPELAR
jgi:hypothetical protein